MYTNVLSDDGICSEVLVELDDATSCLSSNKPIH